MWALDHKEGWVLKNWCFWTVVLKTLDSSIDCKQIKPVNPKGNQSWIFIGRTDAEAPILWSPGVRNRFISKDPDAEKDWKQEEKGTTEDKIVGSCHQLNRHELQALWDGEGQGTLVCCSPWDRKKLDVTEQQNNKFLEDEIHECYYHALTPIPQRRLCLAKLYRKCIYYHLN